MGIVLAAGGSSRFAAGPKQLAEVGGRPLVRLAVEAAVGAGCFVEVLVVQGAVDCRPVLDGLPVTVLDNPSWAAGMATSLQVGITGAGRRGAAAVVVGLADQPGVGSDDWRTVARADASAPIVVATYRGRRGNPVRLDQRVWDELPTEGDEGARSLIARRSELVAEVACPGDAVDVDTVEDLERWN